MKSADSICCSHESWKSGKDPNQKFRKSSSAFLIWNKLPSLVVVPIEAHHIPINALAYATHPSPYPCNIPSPAVDLQSKDAE
jgi:hypothetical protein